MPARGHCRICDGPRGAEVAALLAAGQSYDSVARATGYPKGTIYNHAKRCAVSPAWHGVIASLPSVALDPEDPIVPLLEDLRQKHAKLSEAYDSEQNPETLAKLSVQARNNLMKQAELLTKRRPLRDPVEQLTTHPDWLAGIIEIARALDGYPEARESVRLRLEAVVGKVESIA